VSTAAPADADLARVLTFERGLQRLCAARVVDLPWGWAVLRPALPLVYDLNAVVVRRPVEQPAAVLEAAEQVLGDAGLAHRRVIVDDPAAVAGIAAAAGAAAWTAAGVLAMVRRRPPDRTVDTAGVSELAPVSYVPVQRRLNAEEPWATPEVLDQMTVAWRDLVAGARLRCFAAGPLDADPVAGCVLIGDGDVAQIDAVQTLEAHRRRGYARAVIQRALQAAADDGYDLVHLFADTADWPRHLYERMGFDAVGEVVTFSR
jgi:GNAT superfamily N-acetyltransferase